MKDADNLHQKVQEHIDCLADTDHLKEMSDLTGAGDADAALKWLALSTLHGINHNAKKITIAKEGDGQVVVTAKYRKAILPSPGTAISASIFETVRAITHIEGKQGKLPLALGVRDSSLELGVKLTTEGDTETITLKFPK